MNVIDDGGQAFPQPVPSYPGMTLRDYFAIRIMPYLLENSGDPSRKDADTAYEIADAMLEARKPKV